MEQSLWLLLTLSLRGTLAGDWLVHLPSKPVCAVTGSSVVLPCSYDYPRSSNEPGQDEEIMQTAVSSEMWCLEHSRCVTESYVFHSDGIFPHPSYHNRVQYLGDPGSQNCSLRISDLRQSDSGTYVFYIVTNHTTQKMPEQRGVQLLVADSPIGVAAAASPSSDITEGHTLRLSCCSPTASPETLFKWYKDTATSSGQTWDISQVSEADSGRYYCQMQTGESLSNSAPLDINVQYPPRKTIITITERPGEGHPVTLTCSSDANPPVRWFTWYQDAACLPTATSSIYAATTSAATVQKSLSSTNITTDREGHHCCVARNKHGSQLYIITLEGSDESTDGWMILTGVIIAILLTIVAVFVFYMLRRKKSSSHQSYVLTETTVS
ncbi:igLON family member 5 isoform 1-T1 [Synchiropus picturatus]